jgi:hypothetical protein
MLHLCLPGCSSREYLHIMTVCGETQYVWEMAAENWCCHMLLSSAISPTLVLGRKVYIRIEFDVVGSSDTNDMFSTKKACYCFLSRVVSEQR